MGKKVFFSHQKSSDVNTTGKAANIIDVDMYVTRSVSGRKVSKAFQSNTVSSKGRAKMVHPNMMSAAIGYGKRVLAKTFEDQGRYGDRSSLMNRSRV
nr:hypothetical protein [Candidatus Sigynarchaeota archaeon]